MDTAVVAAVRVPLATTLRRAVVLFVATATAAAFVVLGAARDRAVSVKDERAGTGHITDLMAHSDQHVLCVGSDCGGNAADAPPSEDLAGTIRLQSVSGRSASWFPYRGVEVLHVVDRPVEVDVSVWGRLEGDA